MEEIKININEMEAKAYVQLLQQSSVNPETGYILTNLKYKILQKFQKLQDKKEKTAKKTKKEK